MTAGLTLLAHDVGTKKIMHEICVNFVSKEWELEKETKVNQDFLLIKSSGILFIFLPAFYLIIWPMTHQRNLKKYPF